MSGPLIQGIRRRLHPKRQTRRILRLPRGYEHGEVYDAIPQGGGRWALACDPGPGRMVHCPYGVVGDQLWVREAWAAADANGDGQFRLCIPDKAGSWLGREIRPVYRADGERGDDWRWWPGIHMPRWSSRLAVPVVEVRLHRVQSITEADAAEEGIPANWVGDLDGWVPSAHGWLTPAGLYSPQVDTSEDEIVWWRQKAHVATAQAAREAFAAWWDHINGKRKGGTWADNPWVWAVTFGAPRPPWR